MSFIQLNPAAVKACPSESIFHLSSEPGMGLSHAELIELNQLFGLKSKCEPLDGTDKDQVEEDFDIISPPVATLRVKPLKPGELPENSVNDLILVIVRCVRMPDEKGA